MAQDEAGRSRRRGERSGRPRARDRSPSRPARPDGTPRSERGRRTSRPARETPRGAELAGAQLSAAQLSGSESSGAESSGAGLPDAESPGARKGKAAPGGAELAGDGANGGGPNGDGANGGLDSILEPEPRPARKAARTSGMAEKLLARVAQVNARRAITVIVVVVVLGLMMAVPVRTYVAQHSELKQVKAENAQIEREVADYEGKVAEQNDPAHYEAKARERLGYQMPGEMAVVVQFPDRSEEEARQEQERRREENTWYQNLWDSVSTPPEN